MKYGLLALALLFWGCLNPQKVITSSAEEGKSMTIIDFTKLNTNGLSDSVASQELLPLSSLAEDFHVVKLETGSNCLVAGSAKYFIGNDFILVVQDDQVMLFGKDGAFRRVVALCGRGPREYDKIIDWAVNEEEGLVYLLNDYGDVKMYSLSDRSYFKHVVAVGGDSFYNSMIALGGGKMLLAPFLYKSSKHLLFCMDTIGNFLNGVPCPPNDRGLLYDGRRMIYNVGEEAFYVSWSSDTIYRWTGEALIPRWIFLVGDKRIQLEGETHASLFLTLKTVLAEEEKDEVTWTKYSNRSYCFDKKEGRLFKFDQVYDDYFLPWNWDIGQLHIQDGERFYRVHPASVLDMMIPSVLDEKDVNPDIKTRLKELQKTLTPDDNPVLLVGNFK